MVAYRIREGVNNVVPIARTDGITLHAPAAQLDAIHGLNLNYFGDLSGCGFVISSPDGAEACTCFRFIETSNLN